MKTITIATKQNMAVISICSFSIGAIAEGLIGPRAKSLMHAIIFFAIALAMGVFAYVVGLLFSADYYPESVVPSGAILVAALIMKPEPMRPIQDEDEQEFYDSYVHSREGAAQRLRRRARDLERRIRRLEDSVSSREFDWDQRIRQ